MKVVCAWCKGGLGEKEPLEDGRITHGICPPCKDRFFTLKARRPPKEGKEMTGERITKAIQTIIPGADVKVLELDPWRAKIRVGFKRYLVYWSPAEMEPVHLLFFSLGDLDYT